MPLQPFFLRMSASLVASGVLVTAAWADDRSPTTPLLPKYQ